MNDFVRAGLAEKLLQSDQLVAEIQIPSDYKRLAWQTLDHRLRNFLVKQENQWLVMPGLRGVGKTTLLAQLYNHPALGMLPAKKIYLSLDTLSLTEASMNDFVEIIRHWRHEIYRDEAFFIFLDEVHFDPQWATACKVIFDKIARVFLVCTGSSALSLRLSSDSARRLDVVKIHPLHLTEAVIIDQINRDFQKLTLPVKGLDRHLQEGLFDAQNAEQVYSKLSSCRQQVSAYYRAIEQVDPIYGDYPDNQSMITRLLDDYINGYRTLPFFNSRSNQLTTPKQLGLIQSLANESEKDLSIVKSRILRTIRQTISEDVLRLFNAEPTGLNFQLRSSTVNLLPRLILILANSANVSLAKIGKELGDTHQKTLKMMLKVLMISEMISEISPLGASLAKNSRTPKYLFCAPALRQSLVPLNPSSLIDQNDYSTRLRESLLEDTIMMYLERLFGQPADKRSIEYDSEKNGASFIITPTGLMSNAVIIETGYQKKNAKQIHKTLKKGGRYGLVVTTGTDLRLDKFNRAVYVPLEYFLLA